MSDAPNNTNQQGLGKSAPLVKVQNVHSGVRTSATQGITNHPLAPTAAVELSEQKGTSTSTSETVPTSNTSAPSQPPPKAPVTPTVVSKIPPKKTITPTPKKQASSLDEMADEFLSQPVSNQTAAAATATPLLKPIPLPKDQEGIERLRTLVVRRAWGDVLSVCGQMLRGPSTSPYTQLYSSLISSTEADTVDIHEFTKEQKQEVVEILTLECHAWLKLRRYNELGREVDKWNFLKNKYDDDDDDDDDGGSGDGNANAASSWVPWSLHILAAESLQYTDPSSSRCTDALFVLRDTLVEHKEMKWLTSIDNALVNAFIRRKEWRLAFVSLDSMLKHIPDTVKESVEKGNDVNALTTAYCCEILSRQGRLFLEVGALAEAATLLEECKSKWNSASSSTSTQSDKSHWIFEYIPIQILVNDGLLSFAYLQYDAAMTHFRKSIELLQAQQEGDVYRKEDWMGPTVLRMETDSLLLSNCWNNLALCALYTCRMQDAVRMMESLVRQNPSLYLTERLAFNLSTLYELGSDAAASTRKKRILQLIAKRFYLHDIGPESFRVN